MFFKRKNKEEEKGLAKAAKALPYSKKVQFCYIKPKDLEQQLKENIHSVLEFEPVNYYAEKNRYYQCVFYFNSDCSTIIMRFELFENDIKTFEGECRQISKELFEKILLKFGQRLSSLNLS